MKLNLKKYFVLFLALISIFIFQQTANAWDGVVVKEPQQTEGVYQISEASELMWFKQEVNKGENIDGKLIADIDLENHNWVAIGTTANSFKGVFDGNNHKISNININSTSAWNGAFFGKNDGIIKNLVLKGQIKTSQNGAGSVAGWNNGGAISNIVSDIDITSTRTNATNIGGIVGQSTGGSIKQTEYKGTLISETETSGAGQVGGIVARCISCDVQGNIFTGKIEAANGSLASFSGGIVGRLESTGSGSKGFVVNNISNGTINSNSTNGTSGGVIGIIAVTSSQNKTTMIVINNLSLSQVSAGKDVGPIYASLSGEDYTTAHYANNYYLASETNEEMGAYTEADLKTENMITKLNSNDGSEYDVTLAADIKYVSVIDNYPTLSWNKAEEEPNDPTADLEYLNQALEDLDKSWYVATFKPKFGTDTNVITLMENKLKNLGYEDIKVSVKSSGDESHVAEDGKITYFYQDPDIDNKKSVSIPVTYEFTKNTQKVETPNVNVVIYWDREKLEVALREKVVNKLEIYTFDDEKADLNNVEEDLKLLQYIIKDDGKPRAWAPISWKSSDSNVISIVKPTGNVDEQIYGPIIGKIKPGTEEKTVILTAEIKNNRVNTDESDMIIEKVFEVTVAPVGEKLRQDMQKKLDDNYTIDKLSDSVTKEKINPNKVINDIQFLTPKNTGISDYDNYKFSVTSKDTDSLVINSYRGNVYRPLPNQEAKNVEFTITMKHKEFNIEVSKDLTITIEPLTQAEIDKEIALMIDVKENYFNGINKDNANESRDKITNSLKNFREARYDENNNLVWSYHINDDKNYGIIPVDIDLSRPSEQWNLFKSSKPDLIAHEVLRLEKTPNIDTKVTIESVLSSSVFAKYAEKYPDNDDFKKLARQAVSVEVNVVGEKDYNIDLFKKLKQVNIDITNTLTDVEAKLPNEVIGLDKNNNESTHAVAWDLSNLEIGKAGKYTLEGTITLSDEYQYDGDLKVNIVVNIHNEKENLVYFTIEKFTIGQGYVVEPIAVEFENGDTAEDVLLKIFSDNELEYDYLTGSDFHYLVSIKNVDNGKVNVPQAIQDMSGYYDDASIDDNGDLVNNIFSDLGQGSYNSQAGWYYLVNSVDVGTSMNNYELNKGDIIRLQFTLYGYGADLGWDYDNQINTRPLKDELTKEIALINYKNGKEIKSDIYKKALAVLENYDSTQKEIDDALAALKSYKEELPKYKTVKKSSYTYYYKLNSNKEYDKYKTVYKTSTKTTTWKYRTTGAKKISSKDIITKKGSKTMQKAYYKYNTKGKLTSGKVQKLSKSKFITTYANTKTYYKNLTTIKTNKVTKKNLKNKYTSKTKMIYTSKDKKKTYIKYSYKTNGMIKNRLEYKYNKNGQLKSTSKYGKAYRYTTSYNSKGKAIKSVKKTYNSKGKLTKGSVKVKLRTGI